MKSRQSLVSNSSSSSFIFLGFNVTDIPIEFDHGDEELNDVIYMNSEEEGAPENQSFIGFDLDTWSSCDGIQTFEISSVKDLEFQYGSKLQKIKDKFKNIPEDLDAAVLIGQRWS